MAEVTTYNQVSPYVRREETKKVAIVGAIVNLLLAAVKIIVGWLAHSQALIADGIHSVSDLLSDALVLFAAHHAAQAPDAEHPYGHGRFETAATLGLGILLALVALGIVWDAADRLFHPDALLHPGALALYAAAFSIIANEALYWYTILVARRINSEMLRANAWHHRSDAASSVVVLVGVAGTLAGLPYLDAVAAVIVGLMVAKIGWDLGFGALHELVDSGLEAERVDEIRRTILKIDGVRGVHLLRTRRHGHEAAADVHVQVDPWLSVTEGHMISMAVEQTLKGAFDEIADVTVHVDPEDDENAPPCDGLPLRGEALKLLDKAWQDTPCAEERQRVELHYVSGHIHVDVILPLACHAEYPPERLQPVLEKALTGHGAFGMVRVFYC
ncbi:MAG: cation diffusion facilitator family transporter [Pseudomonadota bacterium]